MSAAGDALVLALDAAATTAERAALLEGRDPALLEELHAVSSYRTFTAEVAAQIAVEDAAFKAFTAELDAAVDDDARLKIVEAARGDPLRGQAFVSEWSWQRTATSRDWSARYGALLRPAGSDAA